MKFAAAIFLGVLVIVAVAALPSAPQQIPSPRDVVAPTAYVSLDPVGRGSQFQIAVIAKIRPGFHINAREKSAEYLIATDLRANAPAGFELGEVSYPKGALHTFTFSKDPLNVYEGTIILRMPGIRAGQCSSRPATNPAEASLSSMQHGNLLASGHPRD